MFCRINVGPTVRSFQTGSEAHPAECRVLFSRRTERPRREADCSNADIFMSWCLMKYRNNFTFTFAEYKPTNIRKTVFLQASRPRVTRLSNVTAREILQCYKTNRMAIILETWDFWDGFQTLYTL
jgi:hypothetical protein